MRPVSLNLKVLIDGFLNDSPWPGTPETINLNDAACPSINGDNPKFIVEQGFVVREGESLEGEVNESQGSGLLTGWTYYTQEDAAALINGWALAGIEWHAATKIYCSNNPEVRWVVSDTVFDVQAAINVCCGTPNVQTAGFVFKLSSSPLTPGEIYLCNVAAQFKWLAVRSQSETRNLAYKFLIELTDEDGIVIINNNADPAITLSGTIQQVKSWPADFIGLTLSGFTLIPEGQVPGVGEKNVSDFNFGTIKVTTTIIDTDTLAVVSTVEDLWALPAVCDQGSASASESVDMEGAFDSVFALEFD